MTSLRPGTWPDAMHVAQHMRAEDAAECLAGLGLNPMQSVILSVERSISWWAWEVDGVPACIFGYELPSFVGATAHPWLLTTPLVERHRFAFARQGKLALEVVSARFPIMQGVVDARYKACIRWLRWIGFMVEGEVLINGYAFCRYELKR